MGLSGDTLNLAQGVKSFVMAPERSSVVVERPGLLVSSPSQR